MTDMKPLKILVADDEPLARERMQRLLQPIPDCEVVALAGNGDQAMVLAAEHAVDLVLLDVRMPGPDGLAVAHELKKLDHAPAVIICTAYDEHALAAFEEDAVDYLLKPVRSERLKHALGKVQRMRGGDTGSQGKAFLRSRVGDRETLIPVADVLCLMAEHKYTTVVHSNGEAIVDDSLKLLQQSFPDRFVRIHRKVLVSRQRLRGLHKDTQGQVFVTVEGYDGELQVSRRNVPAVRSLIKSL